MKVRCALAQLGFVDDRAENVERAVAAVERAAAEGAQLVCLPELATTIYFPYELDPRHFALAEPVPGPATDAIAAAAARLGIHVVFPLYERVRDGELYNSAVVIDAGGRIVGTYRKNAIPLVALPG